jgi:hypothetical protein
MIVACPPDPMEMKKINSGKLRAIGYDPRAWILQIHLDNGDTLQYSGVGEDIWRGLSSSGAAWSFYRDNIEEEFTAKKVSGSAPAGKNPLDAFSARRDCDVDLHNLITIG